jgi:hypothetical protein
MSFTTASSLFGTFGVASGDASGTTSSQVTVVETTKSDILDISTTTATTSLDINLNAISTSTENVKTEPLNEITDQKENEVVPEASPEATPIVPNNEEAVVKDIPLEDTEPQDIPPSLPDKAVIETPTETEPTSN